MEPHCQSVLTPPPPFLSGGDSTQPRCVGAFESVWFEKEDESVRVCVREGAGGREAGSKSRPRDLVIRCLCFFIIFVCGIKAALVSQRCPGLSTDCSPTYSSHLM